MRWQKRQSRKYHSRAGWYLELRLHDHLDRFGFSLVPGGELEGMFVIIKRETMCKEARWLSSTTRAGCVYPQRWNASVMLQQGLNVQIIAANKHA